MKMVFKVGGNMKRRRLSKHKSHRVFRKNTGIHSLNHANPRIMRGGIRL